MSPVEPVKLVAADPSWAAAYVNEVERLALGLQERGLAIEHIGSTAVPSLVAKPIIDIQIGVADASETDRLGGVLWHANLALRNYSRSHPDEARRYGEAKSAAARTAPMLLAYSKEKEPSLSKLVDRAVRWYARANV